MLISNHGASRLGKRLGRPILTTMSSFDASTPFATENMPTQTSMHVGRANATSTRSNSPRPQARTWHPIHGIVFRPAPGNIRSLSTATTSEIRQDHLLHSQAEDDYVLASTGSVEVEGDHAVANLETDTLDAAVDGAETVPQEEVPEKSWLELILEDPEQDNLPETTTSFKMTEELFRAAKNAEAGTMDSYWSHALYRSEPIEGKAKKPTIHYCRSITTTENVLKEHFINEKVLGFDIEWAPQAHKLEKARRNVSLVQIASENRIALLHLALFPKSTKDGEKEKLDDLISPTLKKILEDPEVTKVGVAIKADCTRIRNYLGIQTRGLFELSHLHKLVKFSKTGDYKLINRSLVSLAKQVHEHLHLPLFKGDVRTTDWSKSLALNQIMYAASDSYAALQLYYTLDMKRKALDPVPPLPFHAELGQPIRFAEGIEVPEEDEDPKVGPDDVRLFRRLSLQMKASETWNDLTKEIIRSEDPDAEYVDIAPALKGKTHFRSIKLGNENQAIGPKVKLSAARRRNRLAYNIWIENPKMSFEEIGAKIRDPPLSTRSVTTLILEAIKDEGLPYEKRRLRRVIDAWRGFGAMFVINLRYADLEDACGYQLHKPDSDGEKVEAKDGRARV